MGAHDEALLSRVLALAQERLSALADLPVAISGQTLPQTALQAAGPGAAAALATFESRYAPLMAASAGPRYWGFVTGGTTPAALAGDWLTTLYDQNPQAYGSTGDVSVVIEHDAIDLLRQLLELPDDFFGGFVTGATMANFTGLAVARQWLGQELGRDIAADGLAGQDGMPVLAAVPHSCIHKSLSMLGLGRNSLRSIAVIEGREAMDMTALETSLKALNGQPCIVSASGGTVNTVDFDDLRALANLKQQYKFWLHIDAAFGAFAACSPQFSALLQGWEMADSIAVDLHKWLNVPYDSAVAFVRKSHQVLQRNCFQNAQAAYLGDPAAQLNMLNFFPENSRRLRALPAWMTLMAYGKDGYRELVERSVDAARYLGEKIDAHPSFERLAPVRLNVVCFRLQGKETAETQAFLQRLNESGKVFMTPTQYQSQSAIRAAMVNWQTSRADVEIAWEAMMGVYGEMFNKV